MGLEIDVDLSGFDKLLRMLNEQVFPAVDREVEACMRDGAARAANFHFKKSSGAYAENIEYGIRGWLQNTGNSGGLLEGFITAKAEHSSYVEYGTAPHEIVPKQRRTKGQRGARTRRSQRMLQFEVGGQEVFARKVKHPGTTGLHVLSNAMPGDEFVKRVNNAFERAMGAIRV